MFKGLLLPGVVNKFTSPPLRAIRLIFEDARISKAHWKVKDMISDPRAVIDPTTWQIWLSGGGRSTKKTYTWQLFVHFLGWLSDPFKGLSDLQIADKSGNYIEPPGSMCYKVVELPYICGWSSHP